MQAAEAREDMATTTCWRCAAGYAHSGMLECAQNLLVQHIAKLEMLLDKHPG